MVHMETVAIDIKKQTFTKLSWLSTRIASHISRIQLSDLLIYR